MAQKHDNRTAASDKNLLLLQIFTLIRIPLAIFLAILLAFYKPLTFSKIALCVFTIGLIEATDMFDGSIARRVGIVTEWGAMLDPYADSISRLIIYWSFSTSGLIIPLVPISMAFRDITVAYCRITLTRFGKSVSAKRSGKIKAVFQGVGAVIIVLGPLYWDITGDWTIYFLSYLIILVTLASIIEYAAGAISVARQELKNREEKPKG